MIILFLFTFVLLTNSCVQQQPGGANDISSSSVDVFIAPQGVKPLVFLLEGGTQICRRGLPNDSIYGLERDEAAEQEDTEGEDDDSDAQRTSIITTDVGENWFKLGLLIVNKSTDYFLVVDHLTFAMSAPWGDETLTGRDEVHSGYCQSDPLYIIPPTPKNITGRYTGNKYEPHKRNYVNNLTLFVSGVPVPTEAPKVEEEGEENDILTSIRATAREYAAIPDEFVLYRLPAYSVQLILIGYWIDRDRNTVANFRKSIRFSLSSQFIN